MKWWVLGFLLGCSALDAHDRTGLTAARLIVRGPQVQLLLNVDLVRLLLEQIGQSGQDPREASLLAIMSGEEMDRERDALQNRLRASTHLKVDGQDLPIEKLMLPSSAQLKESALAAVATGHPDDSVVAFESRLPHKDKAIAVEFGTFLGPVIVTYSTPETRTVPAGGAVSFHQDSPLSKTSIVLLLLVTAVGFYGIGMQHKKRRSDEADEDGLGAGRSVGL